MSEATTVNYADMQLPQTIVSRVDISRLLREVERIDNDMAAASIREKSGTKQQDPVVFSDQLTQFIELNSLSMDIGRSRAELITQLRLLKEKSPAIHMTFATAADRESLETLTKWVRESIHPQAIITVGLQPALVGGVYIRTPNHVHDMSLRGKLESGHGVLVEQLEQSKKAKARV